jgi:hypothetical protein
MRWFFTPSPDGDRTERGGSDHAAGLIGLPDAVLQRHGARVLDPAKAVLLSGDEPPLPTAYRARTLLVPGHVLRDVDLRRAVTNALADIGLDLVTPDRDMFEELPQLPRTAALVPLPDFGRPVEVDAWVALQTLRAAGPAQEQPERFREAVEQLSLEHLMVTGAITGSPATSGGGGIAGGPGSGNGGSGPSSTDSYLVSGDPRIPVGVLLELPERKRASQCASECGRRPVVAVLDTGVRAQPSLDVAPDGAGGYSMPADGFVAIDDAIQAAIRTDGQTLSTGDRSRHVIPNAWDKPVAADPLMGEFNPALGHSTFIEGIFRQIVPDARVLAIRIMHSDDVAYEGDIICALGQLINRITLAEDGDLAGMVDVVSLSFGYFSETRHDKNMTAGLWTAIEALLGLGVVVVAAAGNSASNQEYYPAAFARYPVPAGQVPVISVGALNPNGTKAMFSDDGEWVTAWARGAMVVSTYPTDIDASRTPELRIPVNRKPPGILPPGREALDPDDFAGGWAVWSGTSFAAPYLAALITRALMREAAAGNSPRLDVPGQQAAADRVTAALRELRREEEELRQQELRGERDGDE